MKIGELEVLREARQVLRDGSVVKMSSRAFDLLQLLLDAKGQLVSTQTIMATVWPSTIVEENNIQVHISTLRRLLGARRDLLQTVNGRGYRMACAPQINARKTPVDATVITIPAAQIKLSVPAVHGPLFGRHQCLRRVTGALEGEAALVTLTGPPGVGKSRLSIEAGNSLSADLRLPIAYVSLSTIADQNTAVDIIGSALEALKDGLTNTANVEPAQPRAILILDDCDHSRDAVAEALHLSKTFRQLSNVATILTSRKPLRVSLEKILYVPSLLSVSDQNGINPALDMFNTCLRRSNPVADLSGNFETQARRIVEQMDGLPLGLEFAAHHASLLGIETVRHLLDQDVEPLSQDWRRFSESRHSSISAALMWTWTDLGFLSRAVLSRFVDTEHSVDAIRLRDLELKEGLPSEDLLDAISNLVESGFVFREYSGTSVTYRIPNTVRRFLRQQHANHGNEQFIATSAYSFADSAADLR